MTETAFAPLPEGQVSWSIVLPDHEMQLGLQHMEGAGLRVVVWDGRLLRHMAPARARRWAKDLEDGDFAAVFEPVIVGLKSLSNRAEAILSATDPEATVH